MSIYAVINQKGGVGKTTTTANLGVALAQQGKRVLLVDLDPQANLTLMFGYKPKELDRTLSECMAAASNNEPSFGTADALIHSDESIDILPVAQSLAGFESSVAGRPGREQMLANVLGEVAENYDTVLIDCPPTLGQLAINALYAANKTLIPMQPEILSLQGLEQLISTVNLTRRQLNPTLQLGGILLTMTGRAKLGREIAETLRATYGAFTRVFSTEIPRSVKAGEAVAAHKSIFGYAPRCKVATAYADLASEVLTAEHERSTNRTKAKAARAAVR